MNKLAIEALVGAQPGVIDLTFERSERGAILQLRAIVVDESAGLRLKESIASAIGSKFAEERLVIVSRSASTDKSTAPPEPKLEVKPPEPAVPPPAPLDRGTVRVTQIATNVRPGQTTVDVTLEVGGRTHTGSEGGPSFAGSALRYAALATISAIRQLDPGFDGRLDHVGMETLSGEKVVIVALALRPKTANDGWQRLHGVAPVGEGTPEAAAARAILKARYST